MSVHDRPAEPDFDGTVGSMLEASTACRDQILRCPQADLLYDDNADILTEQANELSELAKNAKEIYTEITDERTNQR